jgi:hypothetical protein
MRCIPLVAGALAAALVTVPALAVDDTKPEACNGLAFKDPGADQANTQVPAGDRTTSTEMTGGFIKHDPVKAAEATTYNVVVSDLKAAVPTGYTTISWNMYYTTADGTQRFVRALHDFGGETVYEYGSFTPNPAGVGLTGVSTYEGDTTGKLHEGPAGVVQIVIPAEHAAPGAKLDELFANSGQGRTLPGSVQSPSRGLSSVMDTAPNDGAEAGVSATVTSCQDGAAVALPDPVATAPAPGTTTTTTGPASGSRALPATLVTKSVKAKQAKKTLKLKLRSSERLTSIDAQLRKGTKVLGKGRLRALDGTATLKLKVKKLKQGKYTLDLAGVDASGKRLLTAAALKVK